MSPAKPTICSECDGSGNDREGRPHIKVQRIKVPDGYKEKYTTITMGSGCRKCLGRGVITND